TTLFGGPRLRGPGGLPEKASFVVASLWRLSATAAEHLGENRASRGIFGRSPGAPFDTIGTTGRFILRPHCIGGRTDLWAAACPATDEWNRFEDGPLVRRLSGDDPEVRPTRRCRIKHRAGDRAPRACRVRACPWARGGWRAGSRAGSPRRLPVDEQEFPTAH